MQKRIFSREFKLRVMRQITDGQKQYTEVCREYGIAESVLSRWLKEFRARGEDAFLPRQPVEKTQEHLEKKRAWDRDYYQRHRAERRSAADERKYKLYEYLQQVKAKSGCKQCGENHPAVLQFHHRNPKEKKFEVSGFVYHQKGGIKNLEAEIAKCDVLCANCHLKYHYNNDERRLRVLVESAIEQVRGTGQKLIPTFEEETAHTSYDNYIPGDIKSPCLTNELHRSLGE